MTNERDKIAARIRALLAKTVENGCTEDEALSAAAKVAEMLAHYNLTVDEVQMRASPFARHHEEHEDDVGARLWKIADALSFMTDTRYWTSRAGVRPIEINFFGFEHEVLVARYLLEICARSMRDSEAALVAACALMRPPLLRRRIQPFLDGMSDRLARRLRDLKPVAPVGTGLVVLRGALIDAAMTDAGFRTDEGRARPSRSAEAGYIEGIVAADKVSLNQALRERETVGLLR